MKRINQSNKIIQRRKEIETQKAVQSYYNSMHHADPHGMSFVCGIRTQNPAAARSRLRENALLSALCFLDSDAFCIVFLLQREMHTGILRGIDTSSRDIAPRPASG